MTQRANRAILISGGGSIEVERLKGILKEEMPNIKDIKASYIGAANSDREPFFENMKAILLQIGVQSVDFLRLATKDVDIDEIKRKLSESNLIFISGGEVEDGMKWLEYHNLSDFFRLQYSLGKQFICVSAGTIMMGRYWVNMDEDNLGANPKLFGCLGIIPCIFDTHAENEEWIELKTALNLLGEGSIGYGLPTLGIITATSEGELLGCETDILEFKNDNNDFYITAKRGIKPTNDRLE